MALSFNQKKRNQSKFTSYNFNFFSFAAIPVILVGIFNWAIDPQDIFNTPNYWEINHVKPAKDNNDRLFKAVDVIRLKPKTIIAGSSRTKQGIDPQSPIFSDTQNVYNLAINGPNFYEVRRYIEHAIYNQPELEEIILGLDFFMFNQSLNNQATFKESRLKIGRIAIEDGIQNLFSFDVLSNSWKTIQASIKNPENQSDTYGENGFMPRLDYDNGETIWRFHQSIRLYYRLHANYQFSEEYWRDFQDIVALCKAKNIKLKVFVSPSHATRLEAIYTTEKWNVFEQWKRDLASITYFWDFSGYNSITSEAIATKMEYYVDDSHYTPEIGEFVLQRIFDRPSAELPADFGTIVDLKNIDSHLNKIKSDRKQWLKNNPEELELVRNFYHEIRAEKNE